MPQKLFSYASPANIRTRKINPEDVNSDDIFTFTFASERMQDKANPWYPEILHCSPENVVMDRITSAAPVLLEHDFEKQVGVVSEVRFVNNNGVRSLECDVLFSASKLGKEIQSDVARGIRRNVSVGYFFEDGYLDETDTLHIIRWTPFEVTFTGLPVDISVGVGRSIEANQDFYKNIKKRSIQMPDDNKGQSQPQTTVPTQAPTVIIPQDNIIAERNRCIDLTELGQLFSVDQDTVQRAIQDGMTKEEFRSKYRNHSPEPKPVTAIGMPKKDVDNYSFQRALQAMMDRDWSKAGLELEASNEVAKLSGKNARGFYVPPDVYKKRDIDPNIITTGGSGAGILPIDYRPQDFISLLKSNLTLSKLGARWISGLRGTPSFPRQNARPSGGWVKEGATIVGSTGSFDQVTARPKTAATFVEYARSMMNESNPSIESMMMEDISYALAKLADDAFFLGTGLDEEPLGLFNTPGIASIDGAEFDREKVVEMRTKVEQDNANGQNMLFVSNANLKGKLSLIPVKFDANVVRFLYDDLTGKLDGSQHLTKTSLPDTHLIYGNFEHAQIMEWGILDIFVNPYISDAGNVRIYAYWNIDFLVRQLKAFVYSKTVAWNVN